MKKLILGIFLISLFTSCSVTETIVFSEDGSGEFLVSYDMEQVMSQMKDAMGGGGETSDKKKSGKVMDTTMVFSEIMEVYKDSLATLSEEKQQAFEAVKDMYMEMHMDEDNGVMNMGIGMKFKSIEDLKGIQDRIKKAQSLNAQSDQADAMKNSSPLGKLSGDNSGQVAYDYSNKSFTRTTTLPALTDEEVAEKENLFNTENEQNKEFIEYFEASYYTIKLVFPKKVKSINVKDAEISKDRKTVTYKVNWMDYIKNPKSLDVDVKFYE